MYNSCVNNNNNCNFYVNQFTKLKNDKCTQEYDDAQRAAPGSYNTDNTRCNDCGAQGAMNCALKNPTINYSDGYGWVSYNGCLVNKDSKIRRNNLTNMNEKVQLFPRIFIEGYRGIGERNIEAENFVLVGKEDPNQRKPCEVLSGVSLYPLRFEDLFDHSNPQRVQHIIPPPIEQGGWIRGGADTRTEIRRVKVGRKINNPRCVPML